MFEQVLPALALAACLVLLARLMLGQRRRQRFDAAARRAWAACRRTALRAVRWRSTRREAAAAADEAIRRARGSVQRDGK